MGILIEIEFLRELGNTVFSPWQSCSYYLEIFALDAVCDLFPNAVFTLNDFIISWDGLNFSHSAFIPAKITSLCYSEHDLNVKVLVTQSCQTLCDPMDCSQPGSSVNGILQARILEWVANSFSGDLPDPGIELCLFRLLHWQAGSLPLVPPGKLLPWAERHFSSRNVSSLTPLLLSLTSLVPPLTGYISSTIILQVL